MNKIIMFSDDHSNMLVVTSTNNEYSMCFNSDAFVVVDGQFNELVRWNTEGVVCSDVMHSIRSAFMDPSKQCINIHATNSINDKEVITSIAVM